MTGRDVSTYNGLLRAVWGYQTPSKCIRRNYDRPNRNPITQTCHRPLPLRGVCTQEYHLTLRSQPDDYLRRRLPIGAPGTFLLYRKLYPAGRR